MLLQEYNDGRNDLPKLLIVGDGSLRSTLDTFIRKAGLSEKVTTLGWVNRERFLRLLTSASALIVPSIWPENAPLVALEALSLGTPVVGSDRGGLPEITSNVSNELTFSWERKDDLIRAILYAMSCPGIRDKARNAYQRYYTPERYIASYMQLIHAFNP